MPERRTASVLQIYRVSTKERRFFTKNVNGGGVDFLLWREGFGYKCAIARLTLVNFENGREIYPQSARRKYRKQGALDL